LTPAPGDRLGSYVVVSRLGAGGMGEVYRATDARLGRDVALKLLPEAFASDADRLARFEREAKLLASLNHSGIAHLYGFEQATLADGTNAHLIVMELVEGEDLAGRLKRGPVPVDEALGTARQIAEALEEAHEKGIVHRDLKPANVKVTPEGKVKVLDFGLAKAWTGEGAAGTSSADLSESPTLARTGTAAGIILGTAAYMSPEQARGKPVDKRADIWAFGAVLFEMLTGARLFAGETLSDTLAAVLKTDPEWTLLPAGTPTSVERLLRRCLERDPRRRLRDIGEARLALDEAERPAAPNRPSTALRPSILSRLWPAAVGVALTAAAGALISGWSRPASDDAVTRLSVLPPPGASLYPDTAQVALSPDGRMVAFVVGSAGGVSSQLWVRSLDSTVARRLDAGDGTGMPFWSPDSRRIAFFSVDKLKIVAAAGGRAEIVCDAPAPRGGAWGSSNVIVFAPDASGPLYHVSPNGGEPTPVTALDSARNEYGHRFPAFLPDGEHFLFAALPGRGGRFDVFAGSLRDTTRTQVGSMESSPVYAEPGWLLFARQSVLVAQPFDAGRRQVTGEAVSLEDEPTSIFDPAISFTASHAASIETTLTWLDASGRVTGTLSVPPARYSTVRISPDGTRAALVRSTSPTESSLWLADLARGGATRLSSGPGLNESPVWSPDGTRVVFASDRDGAQDLYVKAVGDASPEQPLYRSSLAFKSPDGWSPDGRCERRSPGSGRPHRDSRRRHAPRALREEAATKRSGWRA
jgi:serine/threonine protein kinase